MVGVRPRPVPDGVRAARRCGRRPLEPAAADDRGRRCPRARGRRPRRGHRDGPAQLLGDPAGRLRRGRRRGPVRGRAGRGPSRRGAGTPAAGGRGRPDGPAGGGRAGRAAARRRPVRGRPGAPVPGRRRLVRILDRLPAGHARAVPGGARAGPLARCARGSPRDSASSGATGSCAPARSCSGWRTSSALASCSRSSSSASARACPSVGSACWSRPSEAACCSARSWRRWSAGSSRSARCCCWSCGPGSAAACS